MLKRQCSLAQACGLDDSEIDYDSLACPLHRDLVEPVRVLRQESCREGFKLQIASGYRNFERQLTIWNQKATGQRPVLDAEGNPLDISALSESERVFAILRWSALPGASRHHWGSDFDIFDEQAINDGYQLQLTVAETRGAGRFAAMYRWLDHWLAQQDCFSRPYRAGVGLVSPEPWHLSYRPVAEAYAAVLDSQQLYDLLCIKNIELKSAILAHWQEIYDGYVGAYR